MYREAQSPDAGHYILNIKFKVTSTPSCTQHSYLCFRHRQHAEFSGQCNRTMHSKTCL